MREIKFRAWAPNCQEMWDWERMQYVLNAVGWQNFSEGEKIIMQYTGLDDCNGVPIYEGDICKLIFHADESFESVAEVRYRQHQIVFWNDDEFKQAYNPPSGYWSKSAMCLPWYGCAFQCIDIHVIGNIHQNPELLEN